MQGFVVFSTTRIWQLAAINLTALGLIALGLGLFGLAPALAAALWAASRLEERAAGGLTKGMWEQYRAEFLRANAFALPLAGLAALLIAGGARLGGLPFALALALVVLAAAYLLAGLVTLAQFSGSLADAFANARLAFVLAPYRLLAALFTALILAWTAWQSPMLGLYFGLSGFCLATRILVLPALACTFPTDSTQFQQQEALS